MNPFKTRVAVILALAVTMTLAAALPAGAAQIGAVTDVSWGISDADVTRTISVLEQTGVRTVRMNLNWRSAEPNTKGVMDTVLFARVDNLVSQLQAVGVEVLMPISDGVPYWASGDPQKRIVNGVRQYNGLYRPANAQDYADFVGFVARRYSAQGVHLYEIWNEPNRSYFWPSGPDPAAYVSLLRAAYPAIKAADPQSRVILGGLAGNAATYLEGLYAAGGGGFFDVASVHPYVGAVDPSWCWNLPGTTTPAPDAFCGLEEVRRVMERNGDSAKKLWLTEFGWSSASAQYGVSESQQAAYLTRAVAKLNDYPWVERAYWYAFRNLHWRNNDPADLNANYGVLRTDFSPKPALAALRDAAAATAPAAGPVPALSPAPET